MPTKRRWHDNKDRFKSICQSLGSKIARLAEVEDALTAVSLPYDLTITTKHPIKALTLQTKQLNGKIMMLIIAAGGDGTINEVINGLAASCWSLGQPCRSGSLPIGTANDFSDLDRSPP